MCIRDSDYELGSQYGGHWTHQAYSTVTFISPKGLTVKILFPRDYKGQIENQSSFEIQVCEADECQEVFEGYSSVYITGRNLQKITEVALTDLIGEGEKLDQTRWSKELRSSDASAAELATWAQNLNKQGK